VQYGGSLELGSGAAPSRCRRSLPVGPQEGRVRATFALLAYISVTIHEIEAAHTLTDGPLGLPTAANVSKHLNGSQHFHDVLVLEVDDVEHVVQHATLELIV
jgi:hypothetical protein